MNFTGDCIQDLQAALFSHKEHPTPYFDATGKVGSGLAIENTVWLGQFKYCRTLQQSLYCLADINTKLNLPDQANNTSLSLRWGICAIDSCNSSIIKDNIETIWNGTLGLPVADFGNVDVNCEQQLPYSVQLYATIGLCVALLLFCVVGTLVDIWIQHKDTLRWKLVYSLSEDGPQLVDTDCDSQINSDSTTDSSVPAWQRPPDPQNVNRAFKPKLGRIVSFLFCFSLYNTLRRLTATTPLSTGFIPCLHGLRLISISWIVLGHTFLSMFSTRLTVNPLDMLALTKKAVWQPVGNAYFAVDTFFLLGGVLVSYQGLQQLDKRNGSFPLAKFYIHRYLRLTPLMGFVMLFWMFVKPYLGDGPQWFAMQTDPMCQNYWWTNLLYIQNFYPTNATHMCIGWVWYLALDMQFYLISPLIIYLLFRNRRTGIVVISLLILASFVVTAFLIGYYYIDINLTASVIRGDIQAMEAFESVVHDKPYCRISPYLVGMVLGYMLFKEIGQPRQKMALSGVAVGWILALGTVAALLYGMYPTFHGKPLGLAGNICYGTFSRFAWAVALSWIIYVCHHGYGGPVGHLLSWPGWAPFSRLTYPVYLFHPVLMFIISNSQYWPVFVSNFTIAAYYVSVLAMAFVSGIILSVLIEIPVVNVERLIMSK